MQTFAARPVAAPYGRFTESAFMFFNRARSAHITCSLFIVHHSLFTKQDVRGLSRAGTFASAAGGGYSEQKGVAESRRLASVLRTR